MTHKNGLVLHEPKQFGDAWDIVPFTPENVLQHAPAAAPYLDWEKKELRSLPQHIQDSSLAAWWLSTTCLQAGWIIRED